jgi:hypothetical protein
MHSSVLSRGHVNHVPGDGICIETVLVHAVKQAQSGHDVECIRCSQSVSRYLVLPFTIEHTGK